MDIFNSYVSLPEGTHQKLAMVYTCEPTSATANDGSDDAVPSFFCHPGIKGGFNPSTQLYESKRWIFYPEDVYDNQPPLLAFHKDGVVRPKKRWDDTRGSQQRGGYPTYGWCSDDIPEMGDICQQECGYSSKISKNNGLKITQI